MRQRTTWWARPASPLCQALCQAPNLAPQLRPRMPWKRPGGGSAGCEGVSGGAAVEVAAGGSEGHACHLRTRLRANRCCGVR